MRRPPLKKQITLIVSLADWQVLSHEAARRHLSLTELCRRELAPLLDRLSQALQSPAIPEDLHSAHVPSAATARSRPAPDHPWRRPFSGEHLPGTPSLEEGS